MKFINGMDVSMLAELEAFGATYRYDGEEKDIFEIFSETGINAVRLRLWNDPYDEVGNPYGGGTNDLKTTIKLAKRIMDKELDFILDIHYSDFWTDPSKQWKPKAWINLTEEQLTDKVYEYTKEVLHGLKENGIRIRYVQVGNEITKGFLWPEGHIDHVGSMAGLLESGIRAIRDFDENIRIMLHLDYGTDNRMYREWFRKIEPFGLDYDIIGMSYYPYWNGSLEELLFNMNDISEYCGKEIIVAETAFGYTTDHLGCSGMIFSEELASKVPYPPTGDGQKEFMQALIHTIKSVNYGKGIGFIYWEPAWLPIPECTWAKEPGCKYLSDTGKIGNSWANQALFDQAGNANPLFSIFR